MTGFCKGPIKYLLFGFHLNPVHELSIGGGMESSETNRMLTHLTVIILLRHSKTCMLGTLIRWSNLSFGERSRKNLWDKGKLYPISDFKKTDLGFAHVRKVKILTRCDMKGKFLYPALVSC